MSKTSQAIAFFFLIVLAMLLAACQPEAVTDIPQVPQTTPTTVETAAPSPTAAASTPISSRASPESEDYGEDYGAPASASTPDPAAPTPDPDPVAPVTGVALDEVKLRFQSAGDLGQILVDERGMTLYRFTNDAANVSNCSGQCAVNWPPLLVASGGEVEIDDMDEEGLIGTITRADGATQVTYKGQPLYYWINDTQPGDTTGQNVNGVWFVVNP